MREVILLLRDGRSAATQISRHDRFEAEQHMAELFNLQASDIALVHQLNAIPLDLAETGADVILVQLTTDRPIASILRFALVDVEVYHPMETQPSTLTRRIQWLPNFITRLSLFRLLHLETHCHETPDRCHLYINDFEIERSGHATIDIEHGDYVSVYIGACDPNLLTEMIEESHDDDVTALFQNHWGAQQTADRIPVIKLRSEKNAEPPLPTQLCAPQEQLHRDQRPAVPRWRSTLQNRFDAEALIELEEEGQIAYVVAWLIQHSRNPRCRRSRTVRLGADPLTCETDIMEAWHDVTDHTLPVSLHHVHPRPIQAILQTIIGHIIVEQEPRPTETVALVTTHRCDGPLVILSQIALALPELISRRGLLRQLQIPNLDEDQWIFCRVHLNDIPFGLFDVELVAPGTHLEVMLPSYRVQLPTEAARHIVVEENIDETTLMQSFRHNDGRQRQGTQQHARNDHCHDGLGLTTTTPQEREPFRLNPFAQEFAMPRPAIHDQTEFVQDLFALWQIHATHWEGEVRSCNVAVWYVNHHWAAPHGLFYRTARLYENYQDWEDTLRNAWTDYIDPDAEADFFLVSPHPPSATNEISAHVVQHQHPQWVTSLVSVFDANQHGLDPEIQLAATTHEHILVENLLLVTELASQCLGQDATHTCQAWYGANVLRPGIPFPGRCGYGIIIQIRVAQAAPAGGMNLLQISARITTTAKEVGEQERLTDDTVAHGHRPCSTHPVKAAISLMDLLPHTTAVQLISGEGLADLPTYLEIDGPGTAEQVQQDLRRWGHRNQVFACGWGNVFLCLPECRTHESSWRHYVFIHDGYSDSEGIFLHSSEHEMTETQLMKHLCDLGYPRAVILHDNTVCDGWRCVHFHHREPQHMCHDRPVRIKTPWPIRHGHQRTRKALIDISTGVCHQTDCMITTAFNHQDLHELFSSADGLLCTDIDCLCLPDEMMDQVKHVRVAPLRRTSDPDEYDRLLIFTDGSSKPNMKRLAPQQADELGHPDTWAFAVVGEQYDCHEGSTLTLFGWAAYPVGYDPEGSAFTGIQRIGSDMAERSALIGAGLWRIAQNHAIPMVICTDAATVGAQAFGRMGVDLPDDSYRILRGIYQLLEAMLAPGDLLLHHTTAHAGDLFNEIVDTAAKLEAKKSFNMKRQAIHLPHWKDKIQQLWIASGVATGLPQWENGWIDVPAPALPQCQIEAKERSRNRKQRQLQFLMSMATANVQSLYKGPDGHAGKLHFLQARMRAHNLNIMAIQEARSDPGMSANEDILRLCNGHNKGQGGIEIWIDLRIPFAYDDKRKPRRFHKSHFQVVAADARRMIVRCSTGGWAFWIAALHAPHSGYCNEDRTTWWKDTQDLLCRHVDAEPLFALADANAAPGECDGVIVLNEGFHTSANTGAFRDLLAAQELCLPATGAAHIGDHHTWTSVDGTKQHCIDHIGIPQAWLHRCTHSQVLHDFDLANINDDHHDVALQMQWTCWITEDSEVLPCRGLQRHEDFVNTAELHDQILKIRPEEWTTDVEVQNDNLTSHLHRVLLNAKKPGIMMAKKPYITEEIWSLRDEKLKVQKKMQRDQMPIEIHPHCSHVQCMAPTW